MKQQDETLPITMEHPDRLKDHIKSLEHERSIRIKDQEIYKSPWVVDVSDEKKFEKTAAIDGRLSWDDKNVQTLYNKLVMMTPSSSFTH